MRRVTERKGLFEIFDQKKHSTGLLSYRNQLKYSDFGYCNYRYFRAYYPGIEYTG